MKYNRNIEIIIKNICACKRTKTKTTNELDHRIINDALQAQEKLKKNNSADIQPKIWRIIMKNNVRKLTATIAVVAVVLAFFTFGRLNTPAWAISETIEALKDLKAVHIVGAFPGGTAEIWMRANEAGTQSTDVVVKGSHGAITWSKNGSTYQYEPSQNTVYFEHALTVGMAQWLGPELLEMLSQADNADIVRGKDPATGRERIMLMCSMIDVHGAQSWIIEFDIASKLPVSMRQWQNLDRSGPPSFQTFKIIYYEKLPDSVFEVYIPGSPTYIEKPLTIPDENIGILSNPLYGISAESMTQQEAAEKAVRTLYQAVINQDLDQLKNISPLCRNWNDEFLRKIVFKPDKEERIAEIIKIGNIFKTGHSKLGPIAAVPTVLQLQNGRKVEEKMIVQFRQIGGKSSCVVHGPYGISREIE